MEKKDLTFPQKNIYMVDILNGNNALNTIAGVLKIDENFDSNICRDIINELIRRNDALRINIVKEEVPKQIVTDFKEIKIEVIDMANNSLDEINEKLDELTLKKIDIYSASLITFYIIKTGKESGMIYLKMHHIIGDAWTLMQIINQLTEMYENRLKGEVITINPPSYLEFIESEKEYEKSEKCVKDGEFWQEYLKDVSETVSLKEKNRVVSEKAERYTAVLSKDESEKINAFCKENRISQFSLFMGALATYVYRIKDANDIIIGTPILNRSNFKEKKMLGCFISTIPIRIKIEENEKFLDVVKDIGVQTMTLFRHQKYPITKTLEKLHNTTENNGKIYSMMLSYQNARADVKENMSTKWIFSKAIQDDLEIHIMDMDSSGNLMINYDYLVDLFESIEIEYLHTRLMALIDNAIEDIKVSVEDIRIMSKSEENKILYEFNDTYSPYPKDKTVIELFEEQALKTPDNVALVFEDKKMTYRELNEKANSLAYYLKKEKGIKCGEVIGIYVDKSIEMMISILASMKLGCPYIPIESDYLIDRIKDILDENETKFLLVDIDIDIDIGKNIEIINVKEDESIYTKFKNNESYRNSLPDSPVYIMYTSGTTGKPKGVKISNKNIVSLIFGQTYIDVNESDRVSQTGSIMFDATTLEYWEPLLKGASLYLIPRYVLLNPKKMKEYINDNHISVMFFTTSLFNQMIEYDAEMFKNLRIVLSGGEAMSSKHVNILLKKCNKLRIINGYGPTETTTFATSFEVKSEQGKSVPIGKPLNNKTCYILDKKFRLMPIFIEGELFIGGDGVGLEYVKRDDLNTTKFKVLNIKGEKERLYSTGDISFYDASGYVCYIGRRDNQVKIRGYRIELDEIQNAILSINEIKNCVAIVKDTKLGEKIFAYYTSNNKVDVNKVYELLYAKLPKYMVPAGIMQLKEMPINRNGKLDRKALPNIKLNERIEENTYEYTEEQKKVYDIIFDMYNIKCNLNDNLFEKGLDSLSLIKVITKVQEYYNIELDFKDLFDKPSIYSISKAINISKTNNDEVGEEKNILNSQKGIFMQYMMDTESTLYNVPFEIKIKKEKIDLEKLKNAVEKSILNHQNLFSTFNIEDSKIIQETKNVNSYNVEVLNVNEEEYKSQKSNFVKPFDLLKGPLFKTKIYITEKNIFVLFDFHHIIFDGVSLLILLKDISNIYSGKEIIKEKITFAEYTKMKRAKLSDITFFKEMLKGDITINDLPYDRPRGKVNKFDGNKIYIDIPSNIQKKIVDYTKEANITLNTLMQSAFMILMSKYMYSEDITIGIADSGRNNIYAQNLVGMLVNTMPYRAKIDWNDDILKFIKNTQSNVLDILAHNSVNYEDIINEIDIPRTNNRNPLFDIMFVCQSMNDDNLFVGNQKIEICEIKRENSKFDLTFEILPKTKDITVSAEYKISLFNESTIRKMVQNYINILSYIISNSDKKLKDIEMISKEEKDLIINKFNNTKTNYPNTISIHKVFEETVKKYSNKNAVIFKNEKLTYNDLNKKANRLARYLINGGAKKGDVVAVLIDKSSEYMIALLGILKAGCVYMPISDDMPLERVKYILNDAGANFVITTEKFDRKLDSIKKIYINIDDEKADYKGIIEDTNLELDINSNDKAYVMYTSGTTGTPKGITVIHKGITRLLLNTNLVDYSSDDVMLVSGATTFDTSGFEIWGAMFYGMELHFMEKKDILTPKVYEKYILENGITTTLIPTPIFNGLVEYNPKLFINLKTLYVCGDVLLNKYSNLIVDNCINTKLFNTYGPTENSVISTFEYINYKTQYDISIGNNISNSTCYVVDKCEKLCPINVPGELYVGGDGLSLGYINKEELNKEKFIYYDEAKCNIYKTGDLTSFKEDGKIKFMGRIDTQIKLRGQRIEVLEIQNKILEIDGINEAVVVVKEHKDNKYLVAYYTSKSDINDKKIYSYLRKYLPSYMVPYRIIKLSNMPLNINGKIDRKALPDISFDSVDNLRPIDSFEENILNAYKDVLNSDDIYMDTNFFDAGGDSLLAMRLVGKLEERNIDISYSDIFEYPIIIDLVNTVKEKRIKIVKEKFGTNIDSYDYSKINQIIKFNNNTKTIEYDSVLLTGATGFLGVHILDSLIKSNSNIKVYCLIREKNGKKPYDRLKDELVYYFGSKKSDQMLNNIVVVNGDITSNKLVFDDELKSEVIKNIKLVINSAAHVKHFGNEKKFEQINIIGVNNVINFCITNNKKLVHISTLSVSGNLLEGGQISQAHLLPNTVFDEEKLYVGQNLNNVYALSKFIAERNILEKVSSKELDACIIRVGNLTARFCDGKFQKNMAENAFLNRIKTFKEIGVVPSNIIDLDVEFSPVDFVADAVVIMSKIKENGLIYHIYNSNHIKLKEILKIVKAFGIKIKTVESEKMTSIIKNSIVNPVTQNKVFGIIQDLDEKKELKYESNIIIKGEKTNHILSIFNFNWPMINKDYIYKFFISTGIIKGGIDNKDGN